METLAPAAVDARAKRKTSITDNTTVVRFVTHHLPTILSSTICTLYRSLYRRPQTYLRYDILGALNYACVKANRFLGWHRKKREGQRPAAGYPCLSHLEQEDWKHYLQLCSGAHHRPRDKGALDHHNISILWIARLPAGRNHANCCCIYGILLHSYCKTGP